MHQVQRRPEVKVGAADLVTGARFVLAAAVAAVALVGGPRPVLGALAAVALFSDFVDGRVARATGTVSQRGARLDQEADAVLILVLSAVVAVDQVPWVIGIGLARYAFGALFAAVPQLRTPPVRPRPWCKVVAALTGIVLAVEVAVPVPGPLATGAAVVVAALLAESFLHEAVDRWQSPRQRPLPVGTMLAGVAVWLALVAPTERSDLTGHAWVRVPLELLVVVAVAVVPDRRLRSWLAAASGLLLGLLVVVKVLDLAFGAVFDRRFDPTGDWSFLGRGVSVLGDSIGSGWARGIAVLAVLGGVAVLAGLSVAMVRLVAVAAGHRRRSLGAATVLVTVSALSFGAGIPVASTGATSLAVNELNLFRAGQRDSRAFAHEIRTDRYAAAVDSRAMLSGLAGKDVLVVFVESYGRGAVQGTSYAAGIDRVLDRGTEQLAKAGYQSRSAFLTSPTFGGASWLAHSTLQSGLWVNSERRYQQLLAADRMTLTSAFGDAGWHTVFDVPADITPWSEGMDFYRFETYYDSRNVGYRGPKFGYAPIPDQYTMDQFRRRELAPTHRRPVMAEIDLVSSHHPWTPLPQLIGWEQVGDGSVYDSMAAAGPTSEQVLTDSAATKRAYGASVEYTWQVLTSFLTTYDDPDLVVVVLGDHQPHSYVSGENPGHDVPVSVIAQDRSVIEQIDGWQWEHGLRPSTDAPVWRMDSFRDRFLAAFSR